jgi:Arc/MetJ family transcription regulator
VIFLRVGDGRPYPDHGLTAKDWSAVAPRQVRLAELVTTKSALDLETLLATDATIFGDLFCHVVRWEGQLYLEDGLHRAVRAALQQRQVIHARVLDVDALAGVLPTSATERRRKPDSGPSTA